MSNIHNVVMKYNPVRNKTGKECVLASGFGEIFNISNIPDSFDPPRIAIAAINGIAAPPMVVLNVLVLWTCLPS